jgi:RHS repeat-associated protein
MTMKWTNGRAARTRAAAWKSVIAGALLALSGLAYAHHCAGYGFWLGGGGGYVGAYVEQKWSDCVAVGRKDSFEEWVGAQYGCVGTYYYRGSTTKTVYVRIYRCVKTSATSGYCTWADVVEGSPSGHSDNITATHSCGTCAAGYHFTGQSACVLGAGDGSNYGAPNCESEGNPIHAKTGNKYQKEVDYVGRGAFPLTFERSYNSFIGFTYGSAGPYWRHSYDRVLKVNSYGVFGTAPYQWVNSPAKVLVVRPDGRELNFTAAVDASTNYQLPEGAFLTAAPFVTERLQKTATGFRLFASDDGIEEYSASGRLLSITDRYGRVQQLTYGSNGRLSAVEDSFGRQLLFEYNAQGRLWKLTDPAGGVIEYGYDVSGRLTTVLYPDTKTRTYLYQHATITHLLTGIIDENGQQFATYTYGSQGRAATSEHAGGAGKVSLVFNADGTTTVTDAIGTQRVRSFTDAFGLYRSAGSTVPCESCGTNSETVTYDANGFVDAKTDFNGNVTDYTHNSRGLEESRTEAYGAPLARTTATQWHSTFRVPTQIDEPGRRTVMTYDSVTGNRLSRTVTDTTTSESRTTTWTYNGQGQILTVNGPRTDVSDVTTYSYYECAAGTECGQVHTITNALGHVTEITSYDDHGNPLAILDPNGVVTTLTYDARQRLQTRTVAGSTTTFDYDGVGQLDKVTLPGGGFLDYTYDAAHRLTDVQDNLGNRIHYTLDALGNRKMEEVFDPSNTLKRTQRQVFDSLGRLQQIRSASDDLVTAIGYDDNGNRISQTDYSDLATSHTTTFLPDALNRTKQVTDAANGITLYGYNFLDQLESVTDPKGLTTGYSVNALGDILQQQSPDTGVTDYSYDGAGNRKTQTDARGVLVTYGYDALNRLTFVDYPGTAEDVSYDYDGTNYASGIVNGIGRLTGITDESGTTILLYNARGNVTQETKAVGATAYITGYRYDSADRLIGIDYPTGRQVTYERDSAGRIAAVTTTVNGVTTTLADAITYMPFGGIKSYVLGNGVVVTRSHDLDYRLEALLHQGSAILQNQALHYDLRGNIEAIEDLLVTGRSQTLGYDALSRVTSAAGVYGTQGFTYDAVGNRETRVSTPPGGTAAGSDYSYVSDTHRLDEIMGAEAVAFDYDDTGNVTSKGALTLTYNAAGRAKTAGVVANVYNASGQRVSRTADGKTLAFLYDSAGHLIAELEDGTVLREYVWLGDEPLSLVATRVQEPPAPTPVEPMLPGTGAYESDANTVALYHFDEEIVTPPLMTRTTPDSGPHGLHGTLRGAVLPAHVPSSLVGYGWAYKFDGVDRGADNSRVAMGTDQRLGFRGNSVWTLDVVVTVKEVLADDGYYRGIVCRAGPAGVDYSLSYSSWTHPSAGPEHEIWFSTGVPSNDPTQYSYAAVNYSGYMEPGETYAIRVTVQGGVMSITVNGIPGTSTNWPAQPGFVSPLAAPMSAELRVGDSCPEDYVIRPSELEIDELRISNSARTDGIASGITSPPPAVVAREIFYFHNDHLATPQKLTDAAQAVVWDASYEPFGAATIVTEQVVQPLRFPGQYFDAETGLHQNWNRDYDPSIGRYLQSDPIGLDGGLSTYGYGFQNPLLNVDPTGLQVPVPITPPLFPPPPGVPAPAPLVWPQHGSLLCKLIGVSCNESVDNEHPNVVPFPTTDAGNCPKDDDYCARYQQRLQGIRDGILRAFNAGQIPVFRYRRVVLEFNLTAKEHNEECPNNKVELLEMPGPQRR